MASICEPASQLSLQWPIIEYSIQRGESVVPQQDSYRISTVESSLLPQQTNSGAQPHVQAIASPSSPPDLNMSYPLSIQPMVLPSPHHSNMQLLQGMNTPVPLSNSSFIQQHYQQQQQQQLQQQQQFQQLLNHHLSQTPPQTPPPGVNSSGGTPPPNSLQLSVHAGSMGQIPFSAVNWPSPLPPGSSHGFALPPRSTDEFPPLYSLPPQFWEPVVRQQERTPPPPTHAPPTPSLEQLAGRQDGRGENFTDDVLKSIIVKAQQHHSLESLAHLTRPQLTKHVDDLVDWWRTANPSAANSLQRRGSMGEQSPSTEAAAFAAEQRQQQQLGQFQSPRQPQRSFSAPIGGTYATSVPGTVHTADPTKLTQEKTIGQCPCCCDAQQNAAFAPCGHLYACTTCAHRLYDSGRGKCPVCRVPIQTYLRIFATN
jgi:Zinc finger, C3HC4 type (RING finger)